MTSDRYLKGVLTVIAACLVYLCLVMTPWPIASAAPASEPTRVILVGWSPYSTSSPNSFASDPLPIVIKAPR